MLSLGISGGPERRESSYSDLRIANLQGLAAGGASSRQAFLASACAEIGASWWSRVLSLATVSPTNNRTAAITREVVRTCGRRLARDGQAVFVLRERGGRLRLLEATHVDVYGGDLHGPTEITTLTVPRAGVVHARFAWAAERPWVGIAPHDFAASGGGLVGGIDQTLSREVLAEHGYIWQLPKPEHSPDAADDDSPDPLATFRQELGNAKGRTKTIPHLGDAVLDASQPVQSPVFRFGANPPDVLRWLASEGGSRMLAVYGLHPSIVFPNAPGQAQREAWRSFLALTVEPLARLLEAAFSEALEVDVALDLSAARAADTGTLARATGVLVKSGMEVDRALELVGLGEGAA